MQFPQLTTRDLNKLERNLPQDFNAPYNLLFIAYEQWQQREVDSWLPYAQQLEADRADMRYYELPVVGEMGFFGRQQLDFWMRTGIRDQETRARTLTLYIDIKKFCRQVGIESQETIALLLLNQQGEIIWRGYGPYTSETAQAISAALHSSEQSEDHSAAIETP